MQKLRRAWASIEAIGTVVWLAPILYGLLKEAAVIGGPDIISIALIVIGVAGLSLSLMSKRGKKEKPFTPTAEPRKPGGVLNHPGAESLHVGSRFKNGAGIENLRGDGNQPGGRSLDIDTTFE
jgi:hypothetical protein